MSKFVNEPEILRQINEKKLEVETSQKPKIDEFTK